MPTLTLPPVTRAVTVACATVGATVLAAFGLTGPVDHEPGPDTPDGDD